MIKIVVIDENTQSKEILTSILNNIENTKVLGSFNSIQEITNPNDINLIIFDINSKNANEIFKTINELKKQTPELKFIATSYEINSTLVSETLSQGVQDFLLKPIIPNILEASIKKNSATTPKKAKTISIFSNKGGIGKTSITVNLAYEIYNKTKEKICLLDLSFNSEDASTFLNTEQKYNLDYILKNIEHSDEKLLLSLMSRYQESELYILEAQETINPELKYTPESISKIINSLKNIFDYIIIDTSSFINEFNVSILNNSDLILMIAMSSMPAIRNIQKCCELFDKIGYSDDKIKLVINRYLENQEITLQDIKKSTGKNVFHTIPNNYLTLIDAINIGKTVGELNPQSNIAKSYIKLTEKILDINFENLQTQITYNHGILNLLKRMGE